MSKERIKELLEQLRDEIRNTDVDEELEKMIGDLDEDIRGVIDNDDDVNAVVERAILDKRVRVGENARVGGGVHHSEIKLVLIGKNTELPAGIVVEPGAEIGTDVEPADFKELHVKAGQPVQSNRKPYEI